MRSNPQLHVAARRSVTKFLAEAHMAPTRAVPVAIALAVVACLQGCDSRGQPPEPPAAAPLLYVTPQAASVGAGGEPVTFTALLRGASGTIAWSLDPAGIGALSASFGVVVAYQPPPTVVAPTTVRLTASAAGMSDSAAITVSPVNPPPGASLVLAPDTACLVAGAGPTTFVARLENAYGRITWSLDPPNAGALSGTSGAAVAYTPPVATPGPALVTITVTSAGLADAATVTVVSEPPGATPVVAALSPSRTVAGGPDLALTVEGTGFAPGSVVRWNGADRDTTYIGCTRVVASIPQEDLALAGAPQVSVVNPGGVGSNARAFAIDHRRVARVAVPTNGAAANDISLPNRGLNPATSAEGRFVAFESWASNLRSPDGRRNAEIFLRDTCLGAPPGCAPSTAAISALVSHSGPHNNPTITPDGRFVAFHNANGGPRASLGGIYVWDTCQGAPSGCSPSMEYVSLPAEGWTPVPWWEYAFLGWNPAISSDGRVVAFYSEWSLVPEDQPASGGDAYVRDTCRGAPAGCTPTTTLVSANALGAAGGLDESSSIGISANGRFVAFLSTAPDLVPEDTNEQPDVFLRDTCLGGPADCTPATERVSVADDGAEGNGPALHASIGSSGRFVVFASEASNFVPGDSNAVPDVFVRDTCRGASPGCVPRTELVSLASDGSQGDGSSLVPRMSADDRYVVFASEASNLVPNDTNGVQDVFLRDTCRGAEAACTPSTIMLSSAADGSPANAGSSLPAISADGRVVVFVSGASNLGAGDLGVADLLLVPTCVDPGSAGCGPGGTLRVTTATAGVDLDPDGYAIHLRRLSTGSRDVARVPVLGTSTLSALAPDTYEVTLAGLAPNCDADAAARSTVAIAPGETVDVSFAVTCAPDTALAFVYPALNPQLHVVSSNGTNPFYVGFMSPAWDPAWSPANSIAFTRDIGSGLALACQSILTWVPRPFDPYWEIDLGALSCFGDPAPSYQPSWSPDGARIAFVSERDGNPEIYVANSDWTDPVRLTTDPASDLFPVWSPDGARIAFARSDAAGSRIYVVSADGSGALLLTSDLAEETTPAWSPDGTRIAYARRECRDGPAGRVCDPWDIYVRHPDGTAEPVALGSAVADALDPAWSPDGRKIAYSYRLRDSASDPEEASALAVVRVDGSRPDLPAPLRDEFIYGIGERPAWRR